MVAVAFAGCADPEASPSASDLADDTGTSTELALGDGADNATAFLADEPGTPRTLYLTADGALVEEPGAAGSVASQSTYHECLGLGDCGVLEFRSPALERSALVHAETVTFTLWLRSTAPVASSNAFDAGAWFGSSRAVPAFAQALYGAPIMPGAPVKFEFSYDFGTERSIMVPAGDAFRLWVILGGFHDGGSVLELLTGGETASAVAFTAGNASFVPPAAGFAEETATVGTVDVPGFFAGTPADGEGRSFRWHSFTVGANVSQLEIRLTMTDAVRNPSDIDMDLLQGSDQLSGGHTPYPTETIYLAGPALDGLQGQELRVKVTSFAAVKATYQLVIAQG